jgi:putative ABC transport system permease protein
VFAIAVASGLLFGIAPAFWTGKRVPAEVLKEGGRSGSGGQWMGRLGNTLVVSEVALALLLTVGAGLFARSLWRLRQVDPGFEPSGLLTFSLSLPSIRYDSAGKIVRFFGELVRKAKALPGVDGAATVSQLPLTSPPWSSDFSIAGRGRQDFGSNVVHREISPEYQRVMKVRLVRGRLLTEQDRSGTPRVVLINEALAGRYFRNEDPVGQRICFDRIPDSTSVWRTIVGVVGSERQAGLAREPLPEFIAPFAQDVHSFATVVVRTRGEPSSLGPAMRRLVADMDPNLAIASMRTMDDVRGQSVALQRFLTTMLLVFSGVGLLLAVVGVYGVMAQFAQRRFREMGIRIALGAQAAQVQWLVLRQGMALVGVGVVIGTAIALATTGALRLLLFEVAPADAVTFAVVPLVLAVTALAGTWLPAMRASRSDPVRALREE